MNLLTKCTYLISAALSITAYAAEADPRFSGSSEYYSATEDWAKVDTPSTLSQFVYQDRNVNGVYDLGDIAMSRVVVRLEKIKEGFVNEQISEAKTNGVGYANFRTGLEGPNRVITEAGLYKFITEIPPGWHSTSANAKQHINIIAKPETRSQLFLEDYMQPVGLAPDTWIAGSSKQSAESTEVTLLDKDGNQILSQTLAKDKKFSFDVEPGLYQLSSGNQSCSVEVINMPIHIGDLATCSEILNPNKTAIFDDLPQHGIYKTPNGYLDINWRDINTLHRSHTSGTNEGYVNGVISGSHVAYTSQARHGEIYSDTPFDFVSVYLTLGWLKAEGQEVLIEMWRGDDKVVSDQMRLSALGPIEYAPYVKDVTRVRFSPLHGWQVVFDDLTIARCDSWWCSLN